MGTRSSCGRARSSASTRTTCAAPLVLAFYHAALAGANPITRRVRVWTRSSSSTEPTSRSNTSLLCSWTEVDHVDAMVTIWSDENTRAFSRRRSGEARHVPGDPQDLGPGVGSGSRPGRCAGAGRCSPPPPTRRTPTCRSRTTSASYSGPVTSRTSTRTRRHGGSRRRSVLRHMPSGSAPSASSGSSGRTPTCGRRCRPELDHGRRRLNMPDGEVFTSPVETATEGEIRFRFPAIPGSRGRGRAASLRGRQVISAEATRGDDYLDGAARHDRAPRSWARSRSVSTTNRPLHAQHPVRREDRRNDALALGSAFEQAGGGIRPALHWDMVCDLRRKARSSRTASSSGAPGGFLEGARRDA